jgi:hypothetical protein
MPAYGLIPDSPLIFYGQKAWRGFGKGVSGGWARSGPDLNITVKNLVLYKPVLHFELKTRNGMVGQHLHNIALLIQQDARKMVGVKTGKLRDSIHIRHISTSNGHSVKIGSSLSYALAHHEGTKPHFITPKPPKSMLRFTSKARIIHSRTVFHPGTKPNKYLTTPLAYRVLTS